MDLSDIRAFFGWYAAISIAILMVSALFCSIAGDWVYRMHGKWFRIPRESFDLTLYCFVGGMKVLVLLLSVVPYLALLIIT